MRLHFSIGSYDYRRTTRFRPSIHFSIIQVLFLLIMCIDAPESTTNSRSSGLRLDASKSCSFNFNTFLASFHVASRAPCSCYSVSSCEGSSKIWSAGATLMRFTWANISERRILVSNFGVTCNSLCEFHTLDRLRHVGALPEKILRRRHVLKCATQLPCIRKLTFVFFSQVSPFDRDKHIWDRFSLSCQFSFFQHSHSTFVIPILKSTGFPLHSWANWGPGVRAGHARIWPKPHLARKIRIWPICFRDRIWPNRIWPELVFQSVDRIWLSPAGNFVPFFPLWEFSRWILVVFLKTGTLKCARLGSLVVVWRNPGGPTRPGRRSSHTTAREHQTCTFERPGVSNTTNIPREDHQRGKKRTNFVAGEGKKKRNFGPPSLRAPPFGPHPSGLHSSGPHPSGPHPSGPHWVWPLACLKKSKQFKITKTI